MLQSAAIARGSIDSALAAGVLRAPGEPGLAIAGALLVVAERGFCSVLGAATPVIGWPLIVATAAANALMMNGLRTVLMTKLLDLVRHRMHIACTRIRRDGLPVMKGASSKAAHYSQPFGDLRPSRRPSCIRRGV